MPKLTDAQRAAFNARAKKEGYDLLSAIAQPAIMAAAKHLDENPNSIPAQIAKQPFMTATIITIAQQAQKLHAEAEAKAEEAAKVADDETTTSATR